VRETPLREGANTEAIIGDLEIIKRHNYFKFGHINNERGYAVEPAAGTLKALLEALIHHSWDT
jgi:hypothetical protein